MALPVLAIDRHGKVIIGSRSETQYKGYLLNMKYSGYLNSVVRWEDNACVFVSPSGNYTLCCKHDGNRYTFNLPVSIALDNNSIVLAYVADIYTLSSGEFQAFLNMSRPKELHMIRETYHTDVAYDIMYATECDDNFIFTDGIILDDLQDRYIIATDKERTYIYKNYRLYLIFDVYHNRLVFHIASAVRQGWGKGDDERYLETLKTLVGLVKEFGWYFTIGDANTIYDILQWDNIDFDWLERQLNCSDIHLKVLLDENIVSYQFQKAMAMQYFKVPALTGDISLGGVRVRVRKGKQNPYGLPFMCIDIDCDECGQMTYGIGYDIDLKFRHGADKFCLWYIEDLLTQAPICKPLSENQLRLWSQFIHLLKQEQITIEE